MIRSDQIINEASELNLDPRNLPAVEEHGDFSMINEQTLFSNFLSLNHTKEIIGSKNVIMAFLDEQSVKWYRNMNIPITNYCGSCNGKGFQVLGREQKLISGLCDVCDGSGVKVVPCKKCQGTGSDNGQICFTCRGNGKYFLYKNRIRERDTPCPRCFGTGRREYLKTGPELYDIETCQDCGGTSISKNSFHNPVLNREVLHALKQEEPGDFLWEQYKVELHQLRMKYFG